MYRVYIILLWIGFSTQVFISLFGGYIEAKKCQPKLFLLVQVLNMYVYDFKKVVLFMLLRNYPDLR